MIKFILIFFAQFLFVSQALASDVCVTLNVKYKVKGSSGLRDSSTENCDGASQWGASKDNKEYMILTYFPFAKFDIPKDEGRKQFMEHFKGNWQVQLFFHSDMMPVKEWKKRFGKKSYSTKGHIVAAGKSSPVNAKVKIVKNKKGEKFSEITMSPSFSSLEMGLGKNSKIEIKDKFEVILKVPHKAMTGNGPEKG